MQNNLMKQICIKHNPALNGKFYGPSEMAYNDYLTVTAKMETCLKWNFLNCLFKLNLNKFYCRNVVLNKREEINTLKIYSFFKTDYFGTKRYITITWHCLFVYFSTLFILNKILNIILRH